MTEQVRQGFKKTGRGTSLGTVPPPQPTEEPKPEPKTGQQGQGK